MTRNERLKRAALQAEAKQAKALVIWTRWRKEAATLARLGYPPTSSKLRAARRQRQAAATRWARAREAARSARYAFNRTTY